MRTGDFNGPASLPTLGFTTPLRDLLEELALGRARVSHDANIDVPPQRRSLHGGLGNAPEQHQQDAALHLVVACGVTDSV